MSEEQRSVKNGHAIYQWMTNPKEFFIKITRAFNKCSKFGQLLLWLLSYSFTLILGLLIAWFLLQFPVWLIIDRLITLPILIIAGVVIAAIPGCFILLYSPGISAKIDYTREINRTILENVESKPKRLKGKALNKATLFRNNFCLIPIIIVFLVFNLALMVRPIDTWNIYSLGIYLGVFLITIFLWMVVFVTASVASIPEAFLGYLKRKFPETDLTPLKSYKVPIKQYYIMFVSAIIVGVVLFILLNSLLDFWLGAGTRPLWDKIAMALLHGQ